MMVVIFCAGILCGMLLPRWFCLNAEIDLGILNMNVMRQYTFLKVGRGVLFRKVFGNRIPLMLILFFSAYTAAGFWILGGTSFVFGISLGFLAAMSALQMGYWGLSLLVCAVLPQWLFYAMAGAGIGRFMEARKNRALIFNGSAVPSHSFKTAKEFMKILLVTCCGIGAEVYVNPWLLRIFLNFYIKNNG